VFTATGLNSGRKPVTVEQRLATMTKGEAANIITRLKHGAQARYEKKTKASLKMTQSFVKEQKRKARENVEVGPLPQTV